MARRKKRFGVTNCWVAEQHAPSLDEGQLTIALFVFAFLLVLCIARVGIPFLAHDLRVETKQLQQRRRDITALEQKLQNEKAVLSDMPRLLQQARSQLGMMEVSSQMRRVVALPHDLEAKYAVSANPDRTLAAVAPSSEFPSMAQRLLTLISPTKAFAAENERRVSGAFRVPEQISTQEDALTAD